MLMMMMMMIAMPAVLVLLSVHARCDSAPSLSGITMLTQCQMAADPQTKPTTILGCECASRLRLSASTIAIYCYYSP